MQQKVKNQKNFHFALFFGKIKKNAQYPISAPFLPRFGQNWIFHKNRAPSLFSIYIPLNSRKKQKKLMSQFWKKTRSKRTNNRTNTDEIIEYIWWNGLVQKNNGLFSKQIANRPVTYPDFLRRQTVYTSNPRRHHHGWCWKEKFFKFVPRNMNSPALPVLIFLCKTFSRLIAFTLRNTLRRGWCLKNSHIQMGLPKVPDVTLEG